jgi:hypothetical protein
MKLPSLFGFGQRSPDTAAASAQPSVRVKLAQEWLDVAQQALCDAVSDSPAKYSEGWFISTNSELAHAARGGDARLGQPSLRGTAEYEKQQLRNRAEGPVRAVVSVGAAGSGEYGVDTIRALQHLVANVQRQTR